MSSPEKKRKKYTEKGGQHETVIIQQRLRSESKIEQESQKERQTLRKKNFVNACEKVSCETYFNRQKRLQLLYLPACAKAECNHSIKHETSITEIPAYTKESFKLEVNNGMWYDALELCQINITYDQYLSAEVMKDIVEIMMNVHDDTDVNFSIEELIDKCQQVLALNFSTHPPCPILLRKCYRNFLTMPMDLRRNTFTDREKFGCSEGIVKYCINRLQDEIKPSSKDEPIVNKYENIPSEMKEGIRGLHWQKEKFEIFELLERPERIKRLMAVLESIIELLQYDLAIWQKRFTSKMGTHIMEIKNKPLLAFLLWETSQLNTGAVTRNCRQIIDLFIYFIHLRYPEEHVQIMTIWLNTMIQTFYICETNSNSDYPNLGKYCGSFAAKFYESMTRDRCLSNDSVIKILERIQPSFMRYLIGMNITKSFLQVKEDNVIRILVDFIKKHQWEQYLDSDTEIQILKSQSTIPRDTHNIMHCLMEQCKEEESVSNSDNNNNLFPKILPPQFVPIDIHQNEVVHVLYVTLEALLDAYSVQNVQDTLDDLNERLLEGNFTTGPVHISIPKPGIYSVSEDYIKKYRTIYQTLKELLQTILEMKTNGKWPKVLEVFNNLSILE